MPIVTKQVFLILFGLMGFDSNVPASSDNQPILLVEKFAAPPPTPPQSPSPPSPPPSITKKPSVAPPVQGEREIPPPPPPEPEPVEPPPPEPPPPPSPPITKKPRVAPSVQGEREIPPPPPPEPEPVEPPEEPKTRVFAQQNLADLSIAGIYGYSCLRDQPKEDAFYMGTIDVYVSKRDINAVGMHEPEAKVGTLTVKYKDKQNGDSVNQEFVLYNFHFSGGDARVRVSASPVWVSKSTGIIAEIRLKSPDYALTDPKMANNTMRIHHCETYPR